jgi:hypothetical protein
MLYIVLGVFVLHKVPALLVWADHVDEFTLSVVNLAELEGVVLLSYLCNLDGCTLSLLLQVSLNLAVNVSLVDHCSGSLESLQDDEVNHILEHLNVDRSEHLSSVEPSLLDFVSLVIEVLPNPGSLLK